MISKKVMLELAYHEGLVRQAYKDSVGVWTWSVGITSKSGHIVERYIDNPQPLYRCLAVWEWVVREKYLPDVIEAFDRPLKEHQLAAALSFHYNTGAIKRATWVKDFNRGDVVSSYENFLNWRNPPEIIPRRNAERDLFFNGRWSGDGTMTEFTRVGAGYRPIWSSARKVEVDSILEDLLG
jgi:GH24 family phage-related lysozyme (muramidase)